MVAHPDVYDFQRLYIVEQNDCKASSDISPGIAAIPYALAVVATSLRLYLRSKTRLWSWDDSLTLFSMVTTSSLVAGVFSSL